MEALRSLFNRLPARAPETGGGPLKMVVGLGNPGPEHARNRHNAGFQVLDVLAERHSLRLDRVQRRARVATGQITLPDTETQRVVLVKPLTYMNDSGDAVGQLAGFYKLSPDQILVVFDDLDLPAGRIRLRPNGGAGGQKGVRSIIQHLHTEAFPRLRVGIGRPPGKMNPVDYVLQNFSAGEESLMAGVRSQAADAIEAWLARGIQAAMNEFNPAG